MKCRERDIDYYRLKRDWSAQCVQRCSECRYICKGNKRIIKDDKLQTLGISFSIPSGVATVGGWGVSTRAQVFGDHGTVRAQGSLENTMIGLGPISEMESPPGWNPRILVQQLDSTEVPSSRHQRTGSETGYGRLNAHLILRSASVCVYILLPFDYSIISLLLFGSRISLLFLPTLHISSFSAFDPWQ